MTRRRDSTKMKAEPVPAMVRVRANLAALGMGRGEKTTVTLTPLIQGALNSGVLSLLDTVPEPPLSPDGQTPDDGQTLSGGSGDDPV